MDKIEKAKILDAILLKFKGGMWRTWDYVLKSEEFRNDIHADKHLIKDQVDYLLVNEMLQLHEELLGPKKHPTVTYNPSDHITITVKGNTVANNIATLGFEFQEREKERIEKREKAILKYAKYGFWAAIVSVLIGILALIFR